MRDIKQAFWIAGQNFYGWKKSPRIWMTFILAAILCLMLSDQIISHAIKYETILQVFEPFIWPYGDASSVMLSSVDKNIFKKLGVQLTSEPVYDHKKIY